MHLFLWEEIVYLRILPNWSLGAEKTGDPMNNSPVDAEMPAFVPA